jgi:hypothetical protein
MPSPFPGMDPYLEDPALWPGLHDGLIYTLSTELNAVLPEGYYSRRQTRLYVVQEDREILPDISAFHASGAPSPGVGAAVASATIEREAPVLLRVSTEEVSESYIEVRHRASEDKVATVIEVLSYSNKAAGSVGQTEYRRKQREVLASDVNLIEIDLLRRGSHAAAPPQDSIVRNFGPWDYLVSLSRPRDRSEFELWLLSVRTPLPEIRVPLLAGDADAAINVQEAFNRCYDEDRYGSSVRYDLEPLNPLSAADAAWADAMLRDKGLRV